MQKKFLTGMILSTAFALTLGGATMLAVTNAEERITYTLGKEVDESYMLGETFSVPFCTVGIDGEQYKMEHKVTYPDGRTTEYQTVALDAIGEYTIQYTYSKGDEAYSNTVNFDVEVENAAELFSPVSNVEIQADTDIADWSEYPLNGVNFVFSGGGGKVRYNEVVNLRDATQWQYFVEYIVNVQVDKEQEIDFIYFTLRDIYDEDNYLTVKAASASNYGASYRAQFISSAPNGWYPYCGYQIARGAVTTAGGTSLSSGVFGTDGVNGTNVGRLSYVSEEKQLWIRAYPAELPVMSLDYDDPEMVDERYLWNGFTADLAYLEIEVVHSRHATTSNLLLTSVNGKALSGQDGMLPSETAFEVDTEGFDENALPAGVVGKTYPVFRARAYDDYGREIKGLQTTVFDENGNAIPIVDDCFTPQSVGNYTIKYEAESAYDYASKSVTVRVEESCSPIGYTFADVAETASCGEKVSIPDGEAFGGVGTLTVTKELFLGDEAIKIYNYGKDDFFEVNEPGEYVLRYTISDWAGNKTVAEKAIAVNGDGAPYMPEPMVPRANIVGREIKFSRVDAIIAYEGEAVYVPVKVTFDGTDITDTMSYTPTNTGVFKVVYEAENPLNGEKTAYEYDVYVNELVQNTSETAQDYIDSFLYLDGFENQFYRDEVDSSKNGYLLSADGLRETAMMQFGRPITDEFLSIKFGTRYGRANFTEYAITFTDKEDSSLKIELTVKETVLNGEVITGLFVNGGFEATLSTAFDGFGSEYFSFIYDKMTKSIVDYSSDRVLADLTFTANGDKFEGFTSGYAYITLECKGITGDTCVQLSEISSYSIRGLKRDRISPDIIFAEDYVQSNVAFVGETYVLKDAKAYDTLSESVRIMVTITAPDGTVIYDDLLVTGKEVELTMVGTYTVEYVAYDESNNKTPQTSVIVVSQFKAPTVTLNGEIGKVKKGEQVQLPDPIAEEGATVVVYVKRPGGENVLVTAAEDGKYYYTFMEGGKYIIWYLAQDNVLNTAVYEIEVNV